MEKRVFTDAQKEVCQRMMGFADEASMETLFPEERGGGAAVLPPVESKPVEEPVKEEAKEEVKEEAEIDIDESIEKLKKIAEAEEVAKEVKKSAEEFIAQLEELKKTKEALSKFLSENAPKEEVTEEVKVEEAPAV